MQSYNKGITSPEVISTPITPISAGAGFGIRFLARGVDLIYGYLLALITGVTSGILFAILGALEVIPEDWLQKFEAESASSMAIGILCLFLYQVCAEGIGGISMGKLICGLRIVQIDGSPCTMLGALKRDLAYHMDGLFFGLIGYESMKKSALRQRYGDVWGRTVVVKKAEYTSAVKRSNWRLATGLMIGSLVYVVFLSAHLLIKIL